MNEKCFDEDINEREDVQAAQLEPSQPDILLALERHLSQLEQPEPQPDILSVLEQHLSQLESSEPPQPDILSVLRQQLSHHTRRRRGRGMPRRVNT